MGLGSTAVALRHFASGISQKKSLSADHCFCDPNGFVIALLYVFFVYLFRSGQNGSVRVASSTPIRYNNATADSEEVNGEVYLVVMATGSSVGYVLHS